MTPIPYLVFKGTAEEAILTYARIFGSPEPQIMRSSQAPEGESMGDDPNSVMHAALQIGDGWIYASDYSKAEPMAGNSIAVTFATPEKSREIFDALAEGGEIDMPFGKTFWSPGFGGLTDRFGTRWMVDTESQAMPQDGSTAEAGAA